MGRLGARVATDAGGRLGVRIASDNRVPWSRGSPQARFRRLPSREWSVDRAIFEGWTVVPHSVKRWLKLTWIFNPVEIDGFGKGGVDRTVPGLGFLYPRVFVRLMTGRLATGLLGRKGLALWLRNAKLSRVQLEKHEIAQ